MLPRVGAWLLSALTLGVLGCTPTTNLHDSDSESPKPRARSRVGTTQGSSVAVTQDERIAVVANRMDGVVSVIHIDLNEDDKHFVAETPRAQLSFPPLNTSQPWAVVIAPDDDTAFVLVRGWRQVVRIDGLHGNAPKIGDSMDVGSEPTSIAISPSGKKLYVANSGDGTVNLILAETGMTFTWDLNWRLAEPGLRTPGEPFAPETVWSEGALHGSKRPGLAHPRALAMTDDGDDEDDDEVLFATEFFAQPLGTTQPVEDPDFSRQGLVYPISVGIGAGNPPLDSDDSPVAAAIPLAPLDTGFFDSEGRTTGCYPNQLYSAATSGNRLYVTSVCASPTGPLEAGLGDTATNNFKTLAHPAIFTIDTETYQQVGKGVVLTHELDSTYDSADPDQRMPLIPNEIVFAKPSGGSPPQAYVTALGASAVFPIRFDADDTVTIGSGTKRFISLGDTALPSGVALLSDSRAIVIDDGSPALSVLDLAALSNRRTTSTLTGLPGRAEGDDAVSREVREGRRLFATGLGVWSFQGRGWSSCESCHPEGLSDGVTWRFSRGPRRTLSLAGTYFKDSPQQRMLLWTANVDEIHDVEVIARRLSGGVGGIIWKPYVQKPGVNCRLIYDGGAPAQVTTDSSCRVPMRTTARHNALNGSLSTLPVTPEDPCQDDQSAYDPAGPQACDLNASPDWHNIDAFIRTVRAPHAPTTLDVDLVAAGRVLFEQHGCPACHGGPGWTLSRLFYAPGAEANGQLPSVKPAATPEPATLNAMLGGLRLATFQVPVDAPEAFGVAGAQTFFRPAPEVTADDAAKLAFLYRGGAPVDQITCSLRKVGTFPEGDSMLGITPKQAPGLTEVRRVIDLDPMDTTMMKMAYVDKKAVGADGFNIPSLVGLAGGGPYFHAGNARWLEEIFNPIFNKHHGAMSPLFQPTTEEVQALVSYLLSIDESEESEPVAVPGATNGKLKFDPDLCAQFPAAVN